MKLTLPLPFAEKLYVKVTPVEPVGMVCAPKGPNKMRLAVLRVPPRTKPRLGLVRTEEAVPVLLTFKSTVKTWPEGIPKAGTVRLADRVAADTRLTELDTTAPALTGVKLLASVPKAKEEKLTLPTPAAE